MEKDNGTILYLRYLNGDENALSQLVEEYSDGIVRFAYGFVGDMQTAEDIMEDTFAAVIVSRKNFLPKAKFKTYLYKIARNKSLDHIRFKRQNVSLDSIGDLVFDVDAALAVEHKERNVAIYRCMQRLSPAYRQVLELSYFDGFSIEEICKILSRSKKQVYNLLARAKSSLKTLLLKDGICDEKL